MSLTDFPLIVLFGESEKGEYRKPHRMSDLIQLVHILGNPPENTLGLFFAIQALHFQREIIYFRVEEEGFSQEDYFFGLRYLENISEKNSLKAVCLPGTGDPEILTATQNICETHHSLLVTTERDLFDYLTFR